MSIEGEYDILCKTSMSPQISNDLHTLNVTIHYTLSLGEKCIINVRNVSKPVAKEISKFSWCENIMIPDLLHLES